MLQQSAYTLAFMLQLEEERCGQVVEMVALAPVVGMATAEIALRETAR
jgi:hypothetical protein